ncbi:multicopper oxidase domain-containing protein [Kocuria rosea]|uniref:multicopper oxidase domain-containing protein n=1 Tax=Kocuria rosea TaxID=1275 RepID=UPI003017E4F9
MLPIDNSFRTYDVVAMSFPIVYSVEGDHDPNGLLYTLRVYEPLLKWAKKQWEKDDEYLPKTHRRSQLMETVVDGIPRYVEMRKRLRRSGSSGSPLDSGHEDVRYLLKDLGSDEEVFAREEHDRQERRPHPNHLAIRQNYRATVDELVHALRELTDGQITRLVDDVAGAAVLRHWQTKWSTQLNSAEAGIQQQLRQLNAEWPAMLAWYRAERPGSQLSDLDIERLLRNDHDNPAEWRRGENAANFTWFNPLRPFPLVRPLVLRACRGEQLEVHFENSIRGREVGMHVQGDGLAGTRADGSSGAGVRYGDGACVGDNDPTTVPYQHRMAYRWTCAREGVWPINDLGDVRGTDRGTNNHGLFAALVVEPEHARWYDSETGNRLDDTDHGDGLHVDVVPPQEHGLREGLVTAPSPCHDGHWSGSPEQHRHHCTPDNRCRVWREENFVDFYHDNDKPEQFAGTCSFREFTVFFHDETETHSGIPHSLPHSAMPLSYRAEPMHNRLPYRLHRRMRHGVPGAGADARGIDQSAVKAEINDTLGEDFWVAKNNQGQFLERVSGEEQHHSSWLFGDPVTPVHRAYRGDPCRVRLVHAGVKETHVYHLHVHQWRAVPQDTAEPSVWKTNEPHGSQLLDSVSIGPQTAMTIDPLYGSGSRQHAVGDIIWHCHLYPHFHHGMWGLWRSFDRKVTGKRAYPDGTPCAPLEPLPGREPLKSDDARPGFPWFIDASYPRKSPPPPVLKKDHMDWRRRLLFGTMTCSQKERDAFDPGCLKKQEPGALFVDLDAMATRWNNRAGVPERRIIHYDLAMTEQSVAYNSAGWYDPHTHHYQLEGVTVTRLNDDGSRVDDPALPMKPPAPDAEGQIDAFFPRANHGDIVELKFRNTVGTVPGDHFDFSGHPVECGLHVHLVKFDVLAADGSASGWNYLSGASSPEVIRDHGGDPAANFSLHRWVVDEEFGTCFFHDHLLANFRQKRGLFGALIAEPNGTRWYLPDQKTPAWVGSQAVVVPRDRRANGSGREAGIDVPFREAGLALGDFVPLNRPRGRRAEPPELLGRDDEPLNEPNLLGGDDDPGVMGVNYRCTPLEYRGKDPSEWFSSNRSSIDMDALKRRVLESDRAKARALREIRVRARPLEHPWMPVDVRELRRGQEQAQQHGADHAQCTPHWLVPPKESGDPDTPVIYTYPGERLRLRLLQGSHEEQHSFVLNGMRWRKDWQNRRSPLVNQQTIGISEAFTVDIDPEDAGPYGIGDHLWQFTVMDDLWLGCWGLIRSLPPSIDNFRHHLPPLPLMPEGAPGGAASGQVPQTAPWALVVPPSKEELERALERSRNAQASRFGLRRPNRGPDGKWPVGPGGEVQVREYVVVAQRHEHAYAAHALTDPWGLIYRSAQHAVPEKNHAGRATGNLRAAGVNHSDEPLVLRAHPGEWLKVTLINEVLLSEENFPGQNYSVKDPRLPDFGPEVSPPRLPVEHRDHLGYPDRRTVSPRVSLHPSLLLYDVVSDDGSYVGLNHDSTVAALDVDGDAHVVHGDEAAAGAVVHRTDHGIGHRDPNWRDYWWYVDDLLAPPLDRKPDESTSPRPGQVCYLFDMADIRNHRHHGLIGAVVVEPRDVVPVDRHDVREEQWVGPHVHVKRGGKVVGQELVLFLQDGLRHFINGDVDLPMPDISPSDPPVDVGQKAISYRSPLTPHRRPMALPNLTAPIIRVRDDLPIWWRLVCAGDKPRNHTFTAHNFAWDTAPWVRKEKNSSPESGSVTAICAGFVQDLVMTPETRWDPGDHAYRSGAFRWAVGQGMWGILRIKGDK